MKETLRWTAARRSNGNVVGFSIRKCRRVSRESRCIFIWKTCAGYLPACVCTHVRTYASILRDFSLWRFFNWFVDGGSAQMHVTPYMLFPLPRRCRLFLLQIVDRPVLSHSAREFIFREFFLKFTRRVRFARSARMCAWFAIAKHFSSTFTF